MNAFDPNPFRSHASVNHVRHPDVIRAAYAAAFEGLEPADFNDDGPVVFPSRELPLGESNPSFYPSLKEILGAERFDRLELTDDGPEMLVRTKMPLKTGEDWKLDSAGTAILKEAGEPVGSRSRMIDADGQEVQSLDQRMELLESGSLKDDRLDPMKDTPTEKGLGVSAVYFAGTPDAHTYRAAREDGPSMGPATSAEDVSSDFIEAAGLSARESQLAEWIADNGIGKSRSSGWTLRAAVALDTNPANIRKMFQRMKTKGPEWADAPVEEARSKRLSVHEGNGMPIPAAFPLDAVSTRWEGTGGQADDAVTVTRFPVGTYPKAPERNTAPWAVASPALMATVWPWAPITE